MTTEAQLVAILTALRNERFDEAADLYADLTPSDQEKAFVVLAAWFEAAARLLVEAKGMERHGGVDGLLRLFGLGVADGSYFAEDD